MNWNYRVVRKQGQLGIYGVYYDAQGAVQGMDAEPNIPMGEDLDELRTSLELMLASLERGIMEDDARVTTDVLEPSPPYTQVSQILRRYKDCCSALPVRPQSQAELLTILWIMLRSHFTQVEDSSRLKRFGGKFSAYCPDFGIPSLGLVIAASHLDTSVDVSQFQRDLLGALPGYLVDAISTYQQALVFVDDIDCPLSDVAQFVESMCIGPIADVVVATDSRQAHPQETQQGVQPTLPSCES